MIRTNFDIQHSNMYQNRYKKNRHCGVYFFIVFFSAFCKKCHILYNIIKKGDVYMDENKQSVTNITNLDKKKETEIFTFLQNSRSFALQQI